jgi:hypothetical protein
MRGLLNGEVDHETLMSTIEGQPLDSRQLDAQLIGDKTVAQYGTRYYINSENVVERRKEKMWICPKFWLPVRKSVKRLINYD